MPRYLELKTGEIIERNDPFRLPSGTYISGFTGDEWEAKVLVENYKKSLSLKHPSEVKNILQPDGTWVLSEDFKRFVRDGGQLSAEEWNECVG